MNATPSLFTACLHGSATAAEWQHLDAAIAADPALARQWCEAARLDAELARLLPPPRARRAFAWCAPAAAAAAIAVAGFFYFMPGEAPPAATPPLLVAASEPAPPDVRPAQDEPAPAPEEVRPAKPVKFSRVVTEEKVMALTFDDGPVVENATRLLKMLKDEGIKATFFPVGANLERNLELAKQTHADGHELGNHTWTHGKISGLPEDKLRGEIERSRDKLREITGQNPAFFRPPYGAITDAQTELIARDYDCSVVLWSVDPQDWKDRDAVNIKDAVLQQARPGAIILLHDIHRTTIDAVPGIIQALKADGWKLVTVTELLKLGPPALASEPR